MTPQEEVNYRFEVEQVAAKYRVNQVVVYLKDGKANIVGKVPLADLAPLIGPAIGPLLGKMFGGKG